MESDVLPNILDPPGMGPKQKNVVYYYHEDIGSFHYGMLSVS